MHIHIADFADNNVRMILPPSSDGQASTVYTYTFNGGNPTGIAFDGEHIHIVNFADDNVRMILPPSSNIQAPTVYTYTLSGLGNPNGMTFDGTHIHIVDFSDRNVRMILPPTSDGQASTVYTYTVDGLDNPSSMTFDGTHIHITDQADRNVRMILPPTSNIQAPTVYTYTVDGLGGPNGMTFDGTHIHIVDSNDDNVRMILPPTSDGQASTVYTYTVDGLNSPQGMTFDGGFASQAVLSLTTTDTDIRVGEAVDIEIDSDIDISNFVASDCTVTNGTRGALTINSATSATLRVTAGSAGTMTVEIAADAVDPGNAEASEDFTVNARVTATITFDDTEGESGGSTGVNIALSESVTGLLLSHLTASDGTLSNVTGSGTSWEADLAFPATGSGTVDIDLAIDSTTPQNAAASASIDYAEAAEAVLIADRLYFISTASDATSIARAYDFSGIVQPDDDIAIGAGFWQGGLSSDTYIYFVSNGTNVAAAYDFFGDRQAAQDIGLDSNSWQGAVASDTRLYFVSDSTNEAVAYDFDGNRQSSDDISLGGGAWVATSRSDDRLYFVNDSVDIARAYDFDGNRQADDDITLGTGNWRGGLRSDTRIYFVNGTNAIAYDYSGVRQSGDDIELGAGRWQGGATIFGEETADALSFGTDTIANQAGVVGTAASVTLPEATGGVGTITYSLSPTLPTGKTFTASTRVLAGTPTGRFSSATFTYTAEDADGTTVELTFTIVVTATAISFASAIANQSWVVGTAVSVTLPTASGGVGAFTYSLTGTLPDGTTFTAGTRALAGTPTGRFTSATFTYTAEDAEGITQTQTFTIVVTADAIVFSPTSFANQSWVVGTAVALNLPSASGGVGTLTASLTGTLPAGVTFTASTRALAGNPTAVFTSASFTYTMTDAEGETATLTFTIVVTAAAVVLGFGSETISNQAWVVGTAATVTLPQATGGEGAITYSLSPTLPAGKTFVAGTRVLAGNPTGRFTSETFTYTATDGNSDTVELTFTVVVTAVAITFASNIANQSWVVGTAVNLTLPTASGGVGSFSYSLTPALPAGVTRSNRVVSGTPTATATVATYTYTATDSEGVTQTLTFTIVVAAEAVTTAGGRLYFISTASDATSTAHAYDFDGARQSADDILLGAGFWQGGLASDTYIYFVNNGTNTAVAYDFDGARQTSADISLDSNSWQAAVASDTRLYFVSDSGNTAVAYDYSGSRQSSDDISLGTGAWAATSRSNNRLFFVNDTTNVALAYDFDGDRQSGDDISLGTGGWRGGLSSDTRLYFVNGTNAIAYDFDGTRQSSDDIALGTGRWQGGAGVFDDEATDALSFGSETIANQAWVVGTAASVTLPTATGGTGTITYSLSPTLPAGKTFTASTRVLAGNPTATFTSETFTYTAEDEDGDTVDLTFTIVVTAAAVALSFGSESINNQAWVVGTAATVTLPQATGGEGAITYSLSPTLPSGKTFIAGTRVLSGNPTGRFTSDTFTYTATDADSNTVELTFTVVVTATAISFASTVANQSWEVGTAVNLTLPTASGGVGSFSYSLTPALPAGVTRSNRVVSGTPTAVSASATYTYTATDSEGVTQTLTFTVVVAAEDETVVTSGNIHVIDNSGDEVAVVPTNTADGVTAVASRTYLLPTQISSPEGGVLVDGNIHVADNTGDEVAVIPTDTADGDRVVADRIYLLPTGITSPRGIAADADGNIHVVNRSSSGSSVAVLPPDTANGVRAVAIRTYLLPTSITSPEGAVDADGNIHFIDNSGDEVAVLPPDTADGVRAVAIRTYLLPTGLNSPRGITLDGDGNLHVANNSGDEVSVIPSDVADGVTAVAIRTYLLPTGITSPEGLVFVPDSEPVVTVPSAPTSLALTKTHNSISATFAAPTDLGGGVLSRYDIRIDGGAWVDTGLDLAHTFSTLSAETEYTIDVAAVNSAGRGATASLSATTDAAVVALSFGSEAINNQAWVVGTAATVTLPQATGGEGTITYSLSPTLPAGKTFVASTRVLAGNPTATFTSETFTYTAEDADGTTVDLTFTIVVTAAAVALSFGSEAINNQAWVVGTAASVTLPTATGGTGTITYSLSPTLPAGKTFVAGTRVLSGTPTGRFASATFTYMATDGNGDTVELTFTIVVTATAISFASSVANQSWVVGTAVSVTLPAGSGGVGTLTASLTGTLPAGVTFTASTRALAGNPTAVFTSASFTYTMTDAEGETESITFTIVVTAAAVALSFGSETISNQAWVVGTAITSVTLPETTGGTGDKTYTLSPTTPAGITFAGTTRVLAGNPTATFTSATFTYTAEDADGTTVDLTFTIVVTATAITFASTIADQSWVVGTAVDETLPTASGGVGDLTYSLSPTTPAGVTFTASTRALAGNPTAVFTLATFTYTVTDAESETLEQTFTIVVSAVIPVASTTSTESTYNADMGYNILPESLGALKKIDASGSVESLGNLWYDERPYNVAGARALSFDDELHVTMGYGNANEVLRYNSLASKADNFVHLVFGNKLKYILPAFQPTGNIYSKLAELARQVGATVSFDGNIISVVDRRPFRAKTDGATGTGTGNLDFDSENKAFPTSGYLRVGDEFIGYTGISSGAFTGITRGALGSEPVNHLDNTDVLYANALFSEREILKIDASTDTTRHHNIIRDGDNLFEVSDETNIAQYRKQPYTLNLGLTRNEDAWIETIFAEYLSELKNLGSVFDLQLRPRKKSFALDLGQLIGLRHGSVAYVLRVELINYHLNRVDIKGRSVATETS